MNSPRTTPQSGVDFSEYCERWKQQWDDAAAPSLNTFLEEIPTDEVPPELREPLFCELLRTDLEIRKERGLTLGLGEYFLQFPIFGSAIKSVF